VGEQGQGLGWRWCLGQGWNWGRRRRRGRGWGSVWGWGREIGLGLGLDAQPRASAVPHQHPCCRRAVHTPRAPRPSASWASPASCGPWRSLTRTRSPTPWCASCGATSRTPTSRRVRCVHRAVHSLVAWPERLQAWGSDARSDARSERFAAARMQPLQPYWQHIIEPGLQARAMD
jgi:hypothetical protein